MGTKLGPADGFRFARGETVTSASGLKSKLIRPLDFLVVTDHSEYLGLADMINEDDPELLANEYGRRWHKLFKAGGEDGFTAAKEVFFSITRGPRPLGARGAFVARFARRWGVAAVWGRALSELRASA